MGSKVIDTATLIDIAKLQAEVLFYESKENMDKLNENNVEEEKIDGDDQKLESHTWSVHSQNLCEELIERWNLCHGVDEQPLQLKEVMEYVDHSRDDKSIRQFFMDMDESSSGLCDIRHFFSGKVIYVEDTPMVEQTENAQQTGDSNMRVQQAKHLFDIESTLSLLEKEFDEIKTALDGEMRKFDSPQEKIAES